MQVVYVIVSGRFLLLTPTVRNKTQIPMDIIKHISQSLCLIFILITIFFYFVCFLLYCMRCPRNKNLSYAYLSVVSICKSTQKYKKIQNFCILICRVLYLCWVPFVRCSGLNNKNYVVVHVFRKLDLLVKINIIHLV